jgi:hypothetical protein
VSSYELNARLSSSARKGLKAEPQSRREDQINLNFSEFTKKWGELQHREHTEKFNFAVEAEATF